MDSLGRIGRRNRARIRHLRLHFMSTAFIAYPAEVSRGSRFLGSHGAANYIGDALELLSSDHNLHSFGLVFGCNDGVAYSEATHKEFHSMFGGETFPKLVRRMMLFKNVREVKDLHLGTCHRSDGQNDGPLTDRDINLTNLTELQNVRAIFRTKAYNNFLALKREIDGG